MSQHSPHKIKVSAIRDYAETFIFIKICPHSRDAAKAQEFAIGSSDYSSPSSHLHM